MCRLTSERNEFTKVSYFSHILSVPVGAILGEANNEMANTLTSYIHIHIQSYTFI